VGGGRTYKADVGGVDQIEQVDNNRTGKSGGRERQVIKAIRDHAKEEMHAPTTASGKQFTRSSSKAVAKRVRKESVEYGARSRINVLVDQEGYPQTQGEVSRARKKCYLGTKYRKRSPERGVNANHPRGERCKGMSARGERPLRSRNGGQRVQREACHNSL